MRVQSWLLLVHEDILIAGLKSNVLVDQPGPCGRNTVPGGEPWLLDATRGNHKARWGICSTEVAGERSE